MLPLANRARLARSGDFARQLGSARCPVFARSGEVPEEEGMVLGTHKVTDPSAQLGYTPRRVLRALRETSGVG
jgi:hypothetical protein